MIRSMTGYGKGAGSNESGAIHVEIKSVNHRFRDINIKLPSRISSLEKDVRKEIERVIARGKVDAVVIFDQSAKEENLYEANLAAAKSYYSVLTDLKKELGLESEIRLSDLASMKELILPKEIVSDEGLVLHMLLPAIKRALESLKEMRISEGSNLAVDISNRLANISLITDEINERRPEILRNCVKRLKERITQLTEGKIIDESRLAQEVAIIAERSDITEEIVRLKSHISQFGELMESDEPVGRKLDFLVQEMNREANTVGSKSSDSSISRNVVEIKADIERLKEQVQNIE